VMRKTLFALLVIGFVWIAYTAWPLYELLVLVRAIEARDLSTVVRHVSFDRIRVSLTVQLVTAYIRRSGIKLNPFSQRAAAVGLLVFSPVVPSWFHLRLSLSSWPWVGQWLLPATRQRVPSESIERRSEPLGRFLALLSTGSAGLTFQPQ